MATITINGQLIIDESSGQQDDDVALYTSLSEEFRNYLAFNYTAAVPIEQAIQANMVTVTPGTGETIGSLFFSRPDGSLFSGQQAKEADGTAIQTYDSNGVLQNVYLYSSVSNPDIVVATTSATAGAGEIVAAFYLNDPTDLSASIEMVAYKPLYHEDPTLADQDYLDWGNLLSVTASGTLSFDFNNLKSGKFLWVAVGTEDNGLLVTGANLNLKTDGTNVNGKNAGDMVNTSQGGDGATIGIDSQMFVPGEAAVFTLVTGFDPLPATRGDATGQDIDEVDYDGYINTSSMTLFISQEQGNAKLDLTLTMLEAGGGTTPEEMGDYDDGLASDTAVPVERVTIKDGAGNPVGTWYYQTSGVPAGQLANGTTIASGIYAGVQVTITGNSIDVNGVDAGYQITAFAFAGDTFNRFEMQADSGKFDIGRIDLAQGTNTTKLVGDQVLSDDDGPGFSAQIDGETLDWVAGNSVGNSLNGLPGADSPAHYTIDYYEDLAGYIEVPTPSTGGVTKVEYYVDLGNSVQGDKAFTLELSDTANNGAGGYTFTAHTTAPGGSIPFNFTDLPSGQNLLGVIIANKANLTGLGLCVFGSDSNLNADGSYSNTSDTVNTSKGGGPVTIGNENQMMDPLEGMTFVFVKNAALASIAGVPGGLTQTTADDADTLAFGDTQTSSGGEVEVVQVQGGKTGTKMTIAAYDIADNSIVSTGDSTVGGSREFVENGLAGEPRVTVNAVQVMDASGAVVESVELDTTALNNSKIVDGKDATGISVSFIPITVGSDTFYYAEISGFGQNYTIAYQTAAPHDAVDVRDPTGGGKWDIGGFNLSQAVETPDLEIDFSVAITDRDLDPFGGAGTTFDDFTIRLDGTGQFDDPNNDPPSTPTLASFASLSLAGAETLHLQEMWA